MQLNVKSNVTWINTMNRNAMSRPIVALLLFLTSPFASPLIAGPNSWTSSGPQGGSTAAIAIDPQSPSTLYAGSPYGVLKSTDGAVTWAFSFFRRPGRIWSIAVNPLSPNEVAAAGDSILITSRDYGQSWMTIDLTQGADVVAFGADGTLYASYRSPLQKSRDLGASWSPASGGLPAIATVRELAGDPSSAGTLFATAGGKIFKSLNGGNQWTTTAPAGVGDPVALAILPSGALLAGGLKGISKSTNGGSSWINLNNGLPTRLTRDGSDFVTDIAIDSEDPQLLYASLLYSGIYSSMDGGSSWQASGEPTSSSTPAAVVARAGLAYAASQSRGILRTQDRGATWLLSNRGYSTQEVRFVKPMPDDLMMLFAGTFDNGLFVTADRGQTWRAVLGLPVTVMMSMAVAPSDPSTIYLGTGGAGLWKSSDRGTTWSQAATAIGPSGTITFIDVDPVNSSIVYAALRGAGVYKSIDGGRSWANIGGSLRDVDFVDQLSIDPNDPMTLYVPLAAGTVVSRDGGMTWTTINGIGASRIIASGSPGLVIASHSRAIFKSTDGGVSWTRIMNGLPVLRPADAIQYVRRDLLSGALYAYVQKIDVAPNAFVLYRSVDDGSSWSEVPGPPIPLTIYSVAVQGSTLYVGSHLGIYERTFVTSASVPRRRSVRR
ncbi:MAG TPA: hypothetical protein VNM92_13545 [Thermoanaerobaculia bacterium]|nr:hypothetical protein [Thermoanaerobaculia bacterium]